MAWWVRGKSRGGGEGVDARACVRGGRRAEARSNEAIVEEGEFSRVLLRASDEAREGRGRGRGG